MHLGEDLEPTFSWISSQLPLPASPWLTVTSKHLERTAHNSLCPTGSISTYMSWEESLQATGDDTQKRRCQNPPVFRWSSYSFSGMIWWLRTTMVERDSWPKTLLRCPPRISSEIKLDMWVDYIAFNKDWIEKLRDPWTQDLLLGTVHQYTQQLWPHQWRYVLWIARRYWA